MHLVVKKPTRMSWLVSIQRSAVDSDKAMCLGCQVSGGGCRDELVVVFNCDEANAILG